MTNQIHHPAGDRPSYREDAGLRFIAILVSGIIITTAALILVVAIWGHFGAPDSGPI